MEYWCKNCPTHTHPKNWKIALDIAVSFPITDNLILFPYT